GEGAPVFMGTVVDVTARHEQMERRAQAQAALLKLSGSEAAGRGDLEAAMREITEVGSTLLGVERCGVWRLDEDGAAMVCLDLYIRSGMRHELGLQLRGDEYPRYFEALRKERALAAV